MRNTSFVLVFAFSTFADASIRPSFWLSRSAWDATDVVELAVTQNEARFRVVASIKGSVPPGAIMTLRELAPPSNDHSLLKDLASKCSFLDHAACYGSAPPIREDDRLIVFLRSDNRPSGDTLLTSTIWLQDGVAYSVEQALNPGPAHLVEFFSPSQQIVRIGGGWIAVPEFNEPTVRRDISRLLQRRESFDRAVANPDAFVRAAELARLVTSKDDVVVQNALTRLSGEGQAAAHALRPLLDDESLLTEHFRILDTIVATKARDIRLAPIMRLESSYWTRTCNRKLDANWVRNYGDLPAYHYLRSISLIKAIHELQISNDLPAVLEFGG
jgi:hypothetical protein